MSLSLKVPELSDKPLIVAETRSHKIAEFIAKLHQANLLDTATVLFDEIEILNRQKVSTEDRTRALEAYRPTVIDLCAQLAEHYCTSPLPLPEKAKAHASLAESLWLELSYGYKLALIDNHKKFFSIKSEKNTALTVQRAMEALRELAMIYHQTYFSLPSSLWSDLNQLYLYAAQQSLHEINLATDTEPTSSISLTYKKALLMALADPQRLAYKDIKRVADYIDRYASHAHLQGLGLIDNPTGIFFIALHSGNPPVAYTRNTKEGNAKQDIFLVTIDLARLLHKHIQQLKSQPAAGLENLPEDAQDPRYLDLLTYLIKHWSEPSKRIFDRTRKNDSVEIGVGIAAAHYFYQDHKKKSPATPAASLPAADSTASGLDNISSSRWVVLNLSAGGIALRKPPSIKENLRVGSLLCMRDSHAKHWSIGVVRWAANNDEHQIDIGTQLIAPVAKAIMVRKLAEDEFTKALILPGIAVLKQTVSIIAASGTYTPAGQLEIEEAGKVSRIIITKLIERTGSFEHFNFSYL